MGGKSTRRETGLSDAERKRLERVAGHPRSPRKHAWRARIVPGLGSGHGLVETIRRTGMSKPTVWRWRDRLLAEGVDGLLRDATTVRNILRRHGLKPHQVKTFKVSRDPRFETQGPRRRGPACQSARPRRRAVR